MFFLSPTKANLKFWPEYQVPRGIWNRWWMEVLHFFSCKHKYIMMRKTELSATSFVHILKTGVSVTSQKSRILKFFPETEKKEHIIILRWKKKKYENCFIHFYIHIYIHLYVQSYYTSLFQIWSNNNMFSLSLLVWTFYCKTVLKRKKMFQ